MSNFLSCLSCLSSFSSICNLHFPPCSSSHLPATAASLPEYFAGPRVRCCLLDLDYTTDCKRETGRLVQPIFQSRFDGGRRSPTNPRLPWRHRHQTVILEGPAQRDFA